MRCYQLFIIFILVVETVQSQNFKVEGTILDGNSNVLPYANLQILTLDSVFFKGGISGDNGEFLFEDIPAGEYLFYAYYLGYEQYVSNITIKSDAQLDNIRLQQQSTAIEEVVVKALKPTVERKIDRYVVSLSGTYVGGRTTLDLLKFAPGVTVDLDGNILLNRQDVTVFVNDRQLRLSGKQLQSYLLSLNSEDIESIEVLPSPKADMDAEGSGGIIVINLKKGAKRGTNGYVNAGYSKGIAPAADGNIGLNYNKNNLTLYANYAYHYTEPYEYYEMLYTQENSETTFFDYVKNYLYNNSHTVRGGLDYIIGNRHNIGLEVDGNTSRSDAKKAYTNTEIYTGEVLDTLILGDFPKVNASNNLGVNFNYIWDIDDKGRKFKLITDYYTYSQEVEDDYNSDYYSGDNLYDIVYSINRQSTNSNELDIYTVRVDYIHPFNNNTKLETGLKFSDVVSITNNRFFFLEGDEWVVDTGRTDKFSYTENIYAGYATFESKWKKLEYSFGLRAEHTQFDTYSHTLDSTTSNTYTELFPTVFFSHPIFEEDKIIINYNRRIRRPSYEWMNPFEYFYGEYTIGKGNPNIIPSYSQNIELNYALKGKHYFTFKYTHRDDIIGEFYYRDPETDIATRTFNNLAKSQFLTFDIFTPFKIYKWWTTDNYVSFSYNLFEEEKIDYAVQFPVVFISSNHYFLLPKDFRFEMNIAFRSKDVTYTYTTMETSMFFLNLSIQKSFWKNKANLRIFANDILYRGGRWEASEDYLGQYNYIYAEGDTRRVGISFKYNFDWGKSFSVKGNEKSNRDELQRK